MTKARAVALFFVFALLAPSARAENNNPAPPRRKLAFLVGVENYTRGRLQYPHNDIAQLRKRLIAMGFQVDDIYPWVDPFANEAPITRTQLGDTLNEFIKQRQIGANDLILFAYSGHGASRGGESYLVLSDRTADPKESRMPMSELYRILNDNCPAKDKLVFIDACRNEATPPPRPGQPALAVNPALAGDDGVLKADERQFSMDVTKGQARKIFVLSGCNDREYSVEDPSVQMGVFMYRVVESMDRLTRVNARNPEGFNFFHLQGLVAQNVPIHVNWMKGQFPDLAAKLGDKTQTPGLITFDGGVPPVLYRPTEARGHFTGDLRPGTENYKTLVQWVRDHGHLRGAYFEEADLRKVNLRGADLTDANFVHCELGRATLDGAKLNGVRAERTDFEGASVCNAVANGIEFIDCRLDGSDWRGTSMNGWNKTRTSDFNTRYGD